MLASTELNYAVGVMPSSDMMVERREVEDWFAKFLRRVVSNTAGPKETLLGVKIGADGAAYLSEALKENTSIASLDVQWNMIGKDGVGRIGDALEFDKSITRFNLSGNSIDDHGIALLARSIKLNRGVKILLLEGNQIGVDG